MRRARSLLLVSVATLALAGCGGDERLDEHVLGEFFAGSSTLAHQLSPMFPHKPGSTACTIKEAGLTGKLLQARCATDVSLVKHDRAVVTLTETWEHGGLAHTWFFFIKRNGYVQSVVQEGAPAPQAIP
ncbi:MAG TPA: hypothetical protein VLW05_11090 [Gaiellaceae bacterium]|jgi:hypothetical protein|nr:hypothetical protein [Gaiellaceae bacterium]